MVIKVTIIAQVNLRLDESEMSQKAFKSALKNSTIEFYSAWKEFLDK